MLQNLPTKLKEVTVLSAIWPERFTSQCQLRNYLQQKLGGIIPVGSACKEAPYEISWHIAASMQVHCHGCSSKKMDKQQYYTLYIELSIWVKNLSLHIMPCQ